MSMCVILEAGGLLMYSLPPERDHLVTHSYAVTAHKENEKGRRDVLGSHISYTRLN